MPILLDDDPSFVTPSERAVYERLLQQLGPSDLLGANVRITRDGRDHEVDILVGLVDAGFAVLEVKGGAVELEGGRWWQGRHSDRHVIEPVDQARDAKYALRDYAVADDR